MNTVKYNPEKHHRSSIRLNGYNYAQSGWYFVTICTKDKDYVLGKIIDSKMKLNEKGNIIKKWWYQIPIEYPHIKLDEFIIMPNHFHGILNIIGQNGRGEVTTPLHISHDKQKMKPTLGQIIAYFKYQTTKNINQVNHSPGIKFWQRNYWERIIRDEQELYRIRKYILDNPIKWESDNQNPINWEQTK
jgi:REP element-mobilizing transposase RayT